MLGAVTGGVVTLGVVAMPGVDAADPRLGAVFEAAAIVPGLEAQPPAGLARPERYREGGYIRRLPEDPWGAPYQYRRPSAHGGQFDVYSFGADGREGGEGNDADIGNWDL